jgi:hypothetical protein
MTGGYSGLIGLDLGWGGFDITLSGKPTNKVGGEANDRRSSL